jgi:hypothetical protein
LSAGQARVAGTPGQEAAPSATAQEQPKRVAEGYVTALSPPDGFTINGNVHVTTGAATHYEWFNHNDIKLGDATQDAVQIGAYVKVLGMKAKKAAIAETVRVQGEGDRKIHGFGLIDKVVATGPEPVYRLDGYRVRVAPSTQTTFSGGMGSLADVGPNTWAKYEGKFDKSGDLIATQLAFYPGKAGNKSDSRPLRQEVVVSGQNLLDSDGQFHSVHAKYRLGQMGGVCGWHWAPANQELQNRVAQIGANLLPAFQKQLAEDERAKVPFRFYVVDEPKIRSPFGCSPGIVLVPKGVIDRLKSDDQIAAVLADGVSAYLAGQSARLVAEYYSILGLELAAEFAAGPVPWVFFSAEGTADAATHVVNKRFEEQCGRMSLALMADAGYDPWQAPEAWRLLAPKKLPADTSHLKYPSESGYQLAILNLQYTHDGVAKPDSSGTKAKPPQTK